VRAAVRIGFARLRSDAASAAALGVLVAVTAFVLAAAPRVFTKMSDEALRATVARANPFERNLEITSARRLAAGEADALARVEARGAELQRELGSEVGALVRSRTSALETPRFLVVDAPGEEGPAGTIRYLTPRFLAGAASHLELVEGALPSGRPRSVPLPFRGEQREAWLIELAPTRETAELLGVRVGDRLFLAPDSQDPLVRAVPLSEHDYVAVEIVGLLEPRDESDPLWTAESALRRAIVEDTETARLVFAEGLFARAAYPEVLGATEPLALRYTWRYEVATSALDAGELGAVVDDVRRLRARFGSGEASIPGRTVLRTGLFGVLERYRRDREAAVAVLAVAGLGVLAVAFVVVGLLAALSSERRARTIELARSRGGSLAQVLGAQAFEGLVVGLPAGAVGFALAVGAVEGRGAALAAILAAIVVLGATAVVVVTAIAPARHLGPRRPEDVVVRASPRRLALEALVVVLAGLGVYLLRRRGLSPEGGFDLYLAAVPILLGVAAALVLFRLYPLPLRAVSWLASRRSDLVPALGFSRAARNPAAGAAPLFAVFVALAVAVLDSALAHTIAAAAEESPFYDGTLQALEIGVVVVAVYTALAILLAPILTARARGRDFAYLRSLGLSRRQGLGLVAVELGPPLVVAVAAGLALGIGLAYVVRPGLALEELAGVAGNQVAVDALTTALLLLGSLTVSSVAIALAGATARRADASHVLRTEEP
jgi:putative ABC transport system permease protein